MWIDFLVLILSLILLPLVLFRTDRNGILFCKLSITLVFLIFVCEIIAFIVKPGMGEGIVFNVIMIPIQVANLLSLSSSFHRYKQKHKKVNEKNVNIDDVIV